MPKDSMVMLEEFSRMDMICISLRTKISGRAPAERGSGMSCPSEMIVAPRHREVRAHGNGSSTTIHYIINHNCPSCPNPQLADDAIKGEIMIACKEVEGDFGTEAGYREGVVEGYGYDVAWRSVVVLLGGRN